MQQAKEPEDSVQQTSKLSVFYYSQKNYANIEDKTPCKCISNYSFATLGRIPSAFILGYYKHHENDDEVDFIFNQGHYHYLMQEERDIVIEETFLKGDFIIDLNDLENSLRSNEHKKIYIGMNYRFDHSVLVGVMKNQIEEYQVLLVKQILVIIVLMAIFILLKKSKASQLMN